jgi:hypothetical protein
MNATTITIASAAALETVEVEGVGTDVLSLRLRPVLLALKRSGIKWSLDRTPGEIRIDLDADVKTVGAYSAQVRQAMRLTYQPADADRPKTLWAGLGNRAGLHGFAYTLTEEKWEKSGARLVKKLGRLPAGTVITVHDFQNETRDRGRWHAVRRVEL